MMSLFEHRKQIYIIISAWDIIEKENKEVLPPEYLKREIPLLSQIVNNNPQKIECRIWGISAQGLDYEDEKEKKRLEEENIEPIEMIRVVDEQGRASRDLTVLLDE